MKQELVLEYCDHVEVLQDEEDQNLWICKCGKRKHNIELSKIIYG